MPQYGLSPDNYIKTLVLSRGHVFSGALGLFFASHRFARWGLWFCKRSETGPKTFGDSTLSIDRLQLLLQYICAEGRICPQQNRWHELWEMLPDRYRGDDDWNPPLPLIFDQWDNTTVQEKMQRLKDHIRYAAEKNLLDRVEKFIKGLAPDEWHIL
jgi:hypothetical protein